MSSYGSSHIWCLCEKLPRSILHIAPTPDHWCEVCGGRRRPRVCYSSSSDEEERAEERRQSLLAAQKQRQEEVFRLAEALRQEVETLGQEEQASCHEEEASCQEEETSCEEEELSRQGSVRVKVAMTAMKPKSCRKSNCVKCGGQKKHFTNNHHNNKLYAGPLGYFRKPQGLQSKLGDEKCSVESEQQQDVKPLPTAPPQPAPTQPPIAKACEESFWERTQDEPNIVAFAHEVCNRPLHLRQCQSNYGSNLFVSDLIPLDKPITDPAGGAISKHRRPFGRPMRPHYSRPLPSLSQMLSDLLNKQEVRAKGGGVSQKQDNVDYGQFPPFDYYDGPSEDALVEDAARQVLSQPKALYIEERTDLPTTRLSSFDSEPSSDCSSSAPFEMPTAPPAERPRVGAPLRLHEMMKAVAQSGLSDSSASSSSTVSSSHKSVSSTLPVLQQPVRSCGGEEPFYEQMPIEPVLEPTSHVEPMSIMEKLRWIIEKNPPAEVAPVEVDNPDKRNDSVEVLRQLMEGLQLENGDDGEKQHSTSLENSLENNFGNTAENTLTEAQHSNDMSNVLPLNSSNKSADAKYIDGVFQYSDDEGQGSKMADNGTDKSSTSMFSFISGLFPLRRSKGEASLATDELKPLKSSLQLKYGSVDPNQKRELTRSCREMCKPVEEIEVRFRNPVAALLSVFASVFFWLIHGSAKCLIFLAGLAIVVGLLFPRRSWFFLNYLLDKYYFV